MDVIDPDYEPALFEEAVCGTEVKWGWVGESDGIVEGLFVHRNEAYGMDWYSGRDQLIVYPLTLCCQHTVSRQRGVKLGQRRDGDYCEACDQFLMEKETSMAWSMEKGEVWPNGITYMEAWYALMLGLNPLEASMRASELQDLALAFLAHPIAGPEGYGDTVLPRMAKKMLGLL